MAITECHNGCTREEQLRWFAEVWADCEDLKKAGVDIRAVTAWSLLGAFDWSSLVTTRADFYEPGVFDIRAPHPRPTAIAALAKDLAANGTSEHPLLAVSGWWHRPDRLVHGVGLTDRGQRIRSGAPHAVTSRRTIANIRPLLITGGTGTLGRAFARACVIRGITYRVTMRTEMDIASPASVAAQLQAHDAWGLINTAGYVRVDEAEKDAERCMRENATGAAVLAAECARRNMQFATFSSDLVFDGTKQFPYIESDTPNPLNVYGNSKLLAEIEVLRNHLTALVIRTSAFFGPWDKHNFVTIALRELANGTRFLAPVDSFVSPTYVPDLVDRALDLMIDRENGIWHLANEGAVSWYELAKCAAEMAELSVTKLIPCTTAELGLAATRPLFTALSSEKAWIMPSLHNALDRYMVEREPISTLEPEAA